MATKNLKVTASWQLAVYAAADYFLISTRNPEYIELATTSSDGTPPSETIEGHAFNQSQGITRSLLPAGAVWVRLAARNKAGHAVVISLDSDVPGGD